ncbi:MAG TPA: DUF4397 domain-containing protein [Thermomicrobiales bacterium]|nr:DUF4397 domain-containing protein [Thermomicrobiales bacterium]
MTGVPLSGLFHSVVALTTALALTLVMAVGAFAQSTPEATPVPGQISTPAITLEDDMAAISVVHAAAAAPAVDILVDDEAVLTGIEFGAVSEFLSVNSGDHNVKVVPAGGDASQAVIDTDVELESGKIYAMVAANGEDEPEIKAFEINNERVADDNSRVIAIHAASAVEAIDIAAVGGDPIIEDLSYFNASDASDFMGTSAEFEVRLTGEEGAVATLPALTLQPGSSIAIIVTADAMGEPTALVVGTYPGQESDEEEVATPAA